MLACPEPFESWLPCAVSCLSLSERVGRGSDDVDEAVGRIGCRDAGRWMCVLMGWIVDPFFDSWR